MTENFLKNHQNFEKLIKNGTIFDKESILKIGYTVTKKITKNIRRTRKITKHLKNLLNIQQNVTKND